MQGVRALIVCPQRQADAIRFDYGERLEEARGLAEAITLEVIDCQMIPVREIRPATFLGVGQIARIRQDCALNDIDLVIIDSAISAIQQRNLEDEIGCKVIDRTGLILEIFGERAQTAEGRLQVELAHLDYQQSRLVRSWTHLERQRGGYGFLGGPGETQIEADRRMIRQRMARLRREIEQLKKTRKLHRARRDRAPWPVIALVGYTNAGKSTIFNRLTGARVIAKDMLFATLDPTMRSIELAGIEKAIFSDTVGFISDLPTQLIAAFRATLEEVTNADLILHVRDTSNPSNEAQRVEVEQVLGEIGISIDGQSIDEQGEGHVPDQPMRILEVWNKIDRLEREQVAALEEIASRRDDVVMVSALGGDGFEELKAKIAQILTATAREIEVLVPVSDGRRIAWLHAHGNVLEDSLLNNGQVSDQRMAKEQQSLAVGDGRRAEPMRRIRLRINPKELGQFQTL